MSNCGTPTVQEPLQIPQSLVRLKPLSISLTMGSLESNLVLVRQQNVSD
jgi:hypothetical protein